MYASRLRDGTNEHRPADASEPQRDERSSAVEFRARVTHLQISHSTLCARARIFYLYVCSKNLAPNQ